MIVEQRKGYIALTTVLIVGMVASVITVSLITLGLGYSRSSSTSVSSVSARHAANACAEEALRQIRLNTGYVSTGTTLGVGQSSCIYTVINTGGSGRQVDSVGVSSTVTRRVRVVISAITPKIVLTSWQEIP